MLFRWIVAVSVRHWLGTAVEIRPPGETPYPMVRMLMGGRVVVARFGGRRCHCPYS